MICRNCEKDLPIESFDLRSNGKYRHKKCHECRVTLKREARRRNALEKGAGYTAKWRANNKEKFMASLKKSNDKSNAKRKENKPAIKPFETEEYTVPDAPVKGAHPVTEIVSGAITLDLIATLRSLQEGFCRVCDYEMNGYCTDRIDGEVVLVCHRCHRERHPVVEIERTRWGKEVKRG